MKIIFRYDDQWVYFSIFDNDKKVPTISWNDLSDQKFFIAISFIISSIQESEEDNKNGRIENDELIVSHNIIAQLNDIDANNLSLPPKIPFILDIRHQGTLSSPKFTMSSEWIDLKGQFIVGSKEVGSLLEHGSKNIEFLILSIQLLIK